MAPGLVFGKMPLADRLKDAGLPYSDAQWVRKVQRAATRLFPESSEDEIFIHPTERALPLCGEVRKECRDNSITEDLILRGLMTGRKARQRYPRK